LPPFLVVNCWLQYLGQTGDWHAWLPLNIFSLGGTVWILTLLTWPIPTLLLLGAWRQLEPAQLDADPAVTGWTLIRVLLLPLGRGALAQSAALVFVLALNNFAVPAILQTKVFTAEVWVSFNTTFDYAQAWKLSWPLIIAPLIVLFALSRRSIQWPQLDGAVSARVFRRQLGTGWFLFSSMLTLALLVLSAGLPVWQLATVKRTWTELPGALAAGWPAVGNSVWRAIATSVVVMAAGLVGFQLLAVRRASVRAVVAALLWVPFLVPGVLLGILFIAAFNRPSLTWFYQSSGVVIAAFALRYLGVAWAGTSHALRSVDPELVDAARLEGANRWHLLRHVLGPLALPQLAAVWYLVFLLCLWDVETLVLIVPPGGETLALRIFNLLHYGHNAQVNALCLTLLVVALAPLVLAAAVARTRSSAHRRSRVGANRVLTNAARGAGMLTTLLLAGCAPSAPSNSAPLESRFFERVEIIGSRGTGAGQFNKPRSLALDRDDNLYVADMTGRVQKFAPDGHFVLLWQMPLTDKGKPKGMGRDRDGNIIVVEPHYSRVNHFTPEATLVAQWGSNGTNAGQFGMPRAVAVNSRGELYVCEYGDSERVQKFALAKTASGSHSLATEANLLGGWGSPGTAPGEFNRPEGLAIDAQDRVYEADSCNHRIQIFDANGKFLRAYGHAGSGKGELSYPQDICLDSAGNQYVCEFGNSRIQVFDAHDQPLEIIGGAGGAPGRFANPWAVALDSHGNLYVADGMNHRVQKLVRRRQT
jgi:ABC-type Fe3+ transport system permease subunit/DNA-binding beta-propeller fold protein YncE